MGKDLYDVARETCHEFGMEWVDPRTGEHHPPPLVGFRELGWALSLTAVFARFQGRNRFVSREVWYRDHCPIVRVK